jgi:ABC-type transporter Mla subunit MlaD
MRRLLAIAALILAVAAVTVAIATAAGDDDAYKVRAIFMNASFAVTGIDVKVAGVKVGKVTDISVTPDNRAAIVLRIDDPGFQDFRKDAECAIRPQSFIGDKFVECSLTQPRAAGAPLPPPLPTIKEGDGKGQHLVPVSQTNQPVDVDLVNNILRLPFRERLSIILNELGTGLAGQGDALRQAIRNADPTLKEADRVIQILADQNKVLADLARDSDRVLAPLARDRRQVADFITKANTTAEATAERGAAFEENLRLLPPFLRQLRPTMTRLGGLADQFTPVLRDAHAVAPDVNRVIERLGPFSKVALPSFRTLGAATVVGRPALQRSSGLFQDIADFNVNGKPLASDLRKTLISLRDTGGIERLLDFLFYTGGATNGFDALGHYFRIGLVVRPACQFYAVKRTAECNANFYGNTPAEAAAEAEKQAAEGGNQQPAAAARVASPGTAAPGSGGSELQRIDGLLKRLKPSDDATWSGTGSGSGATSAPQAPAGAPTVSPTPAAPTASAASPADGALLDYLLGG